MENHHPTIGNGVPGSRRASADGGTSGRARHSERDQSLPRPQRPAPVGAAGGLSDPQDRLRARLRADRPDHVRQHGDGVAAAAGRRPDHRRPPEAVLAGDRDGLHAGGSAAAVGGADLRRDPRRRRLRRHRLVDLSPRVVSSGTPRVRRASRLRAVAVSGRRQCRLGDRTAARRLHRPAVRPAQHRLVRPGGVHRDDDPRARGRLVQGASRRPREDGAGRDPLGPVGGARALGAR